MIYRIDQRYVQGSNAVDLSSEAAWEQEAAGNIIDLTNVRDHCETASHGFNSTPDDGLSSHTEAQNLAHSRRSLLRHRIHAFADSSDMICSLRYEDIRGISLGITSKRDIALFSAASIAIAVLCIVAGA